jgi:hypothetical protein
MMAAMILEVGAPAAPVIADAAAHSWRYVVVHALYGAIGSYVRTADQAGDISRAQARLMIKVRILGLVVRREQSDQTETWRNGRLESFRTVTTINGKQSVVHGEADHGQFKVTTPSETIAAPADVAASDPWAFNRVGPGTVVSITTGKIDAVDVTGGEAETISLNGAPTPARHYHVNTRTQPNKWEVWIDPKGRPIKFRSLEHGQAVDFTLVSQAEAAG